MSLIEYDLFGAKQDKVQTAIDRLQAFEPEGGERDARSITRQRSYGLPESRADEDIRISQK